MLVPIITYPIIPLNTVSATSMSKLQSCLNKALRYTLNVKNTDFKTAKSLHESTKMLPINQIIHKQSADMWAKISQGIAADQGLKNWSNIR